MSPSEPVAKRMLVVDTKTPGTEIFVIDAEGRVVERGSASMRRNCRSGCIKSAIESAIASPTR
jgi:hypothetical protein